MNYSYSISVKPGTKVKSYIAKIKGEHPDYRFDRIFLQRCVKVRNGENTYTCEIGSSGVFEISVKHIDKISGEILSKERRWFVYYRRKFYEISYEEVLFCVFNLKAQDDSRLCCA